MVYVTRKREDNTIMKDNRKFLMLKCKYIIFLLIWFFISDIVSDTLDDEGVSVWPELIDEVHVVVLHDGVKVPQWPDTDTVPDVALAGLLAPVLKVTVCLQQIQCSSGISIS